MIFGIGCDLVSLERMRMKFSERLARKVLTDKEFHVFSGVEDKAKYLAKAWAVKEATYKALSMSDMDALKDVEYMSPLVNVKGFNDIKFHVSVSDDNGFVMATVVAEKHGEEGGEWDTWERSF